MSQGYDLYQVGLYEEFITLEYTGGPKILIACGFVAYEFATCGFF